MLQDTSVKISVNEGRILTELSEATGLSPWEVITEQAIRRYYGDVNAGELLNLPCSSLGHGRYARLLLEPVGQIPLSLAHALATALNSRLPEGDRSVVIEAIGEAGHSLLIPLSRLPEGRICQVLKGKVHSALSEVKNAALVPLGKLPDDLRFSGSTRGEIVQGRADLMERLFWSVNDGQDIRLKELLERFQVDPNSDLELAADPFSYHHERSRVEKKVTYPTPYSFSAVRSLAEKLNGEIVRVAEDARALLGFPEYVVEFSDSKTTLLDLAVRRKKSAVVGVLLEKGADPRPFLLQSELPKSIKKMLVDAEKCRMESQVFVAPPTLPALIYEDNEVVVNEVVDNERIVEAHVESVEATISRMRKSRGETLGKMDGLGVDIEPSTRDESLNALRTSLLKPRKVREVHYEISIKGDAAESVKLERLSLIRRRIQEECENTSSVLEAEEGRPKLVIHNPDYVLATLLSDSIRWKK